MKRIAVTCGEPAGIGPDICLALAHHPCATKLTVIGDPKVLAQRAAQLNLEIKLETGVASSTMQSGRLNILNLPTNKTVVPGQLNSSNGSYVLSLIEAATQGCLTGKFDAMVTAPVHKGIINDGGTPFSGHTEYLAKLCDAETPVMLLMADQLRVALATTHLPLKDVPAAVTKEGLTRVLNVLSEDLSRLFGIAKPRIAVTGLNPHAGEGGHLGQEEIQVIGPVLDSLRQQGLYLLGPLPADTLFTPRILDGVDAVLAMYHDQGLPVLKYSGFGRAVNVTLGLPIIRTSVDHGTALDLAGSGKADPGSLIAAVNVALELCQNRNVDSPAA